MFRTVAGPTLLTSVVHKDERLQLGTRKHVVIATPSSLLSYRSSVFETARVVVVDEADHMITSGGKDMWTILNSLKMRTIVRDASITEKHKKGIGSGFSHSRDTGQGKERQFVFLAATLPARGRKAAFSVLRRWLPDTDLISSSLVHQPVPEVLISYVRVQEEQKLPALLRCLDCLVDDLEINEISLGTEVSSDSSRLHQDDNERNKNVTAAGGRRGTTCEDYGGSQSVLRRGNGDCVSSNGVRRHCRSPGELRVLVFANSAKRAAEAFRLLNGVNGGNGQPSLAASSRDARAHGHTSGGWWKGRCGQIHKDVPPPERLTALEKFRSRLLSVLICTDLAARGLDLPCVSHVIQLDFATNAAQVLHRTGRTARAGSSGTGNFVGSNQRSLLINVIWTCTDTIAWPCHAFSNDLVALRVLDVFYIQTSIRIL